MLLASICLGRMESAPRFSQWLSCSACCGCTVRFWIGRLCCSYCRWILCVALWVLMLPSAVCALSSQCSSLLSLHAWVLWPKVSSDRSAATTSEPAGLTFPALRSRLQTSLKWRVGLPAVRVPVASSPWSMSLGILPSSLRLAWPSHRSRLRLSKANTLGTPAYARTSLFGTRSCQVMSISLWGSAGGRCWVCALGWSWGSRSRRPGTPSSCWWSTWCCPRPSFPDVPVLLLLCQSVFSVLCRARCWWR